jgi:hypothetical protein
MLLRSILGHKNKILGSVKAVKVSKEVKNGPRIAREPPQCKK